MNKSILRGQSMAVDSSRWQSMAVDGLRWLSMSAFALLAGCSEQPADDVRTLRWNTMGTVAELKITSVQNPAVAAELAKQVVDDIATELSAFSEESVVGRLNRLAGTGRWATIPPHTQAVIALSDTAVKRSGGAFDPTVGAWMELWGFRGGKPRVWIPTLREIQETRPRVGWDKLLVEFTPWHQERPASARLTEVGVKLDFGAVAKGYAVDVAYNALLEDGYTSFLVNIGGDMRGTGRDWKVGVRDPADATGGGMLGTFILTGGRATATSGSYERFVEIDGERYSHIINAKTGRPVEGVDQVTVIANTAGEADVLATTLFILGLEEGMKVLEMYPGAEAMFVIDGEMHASPGFPKLNFLEK